MIAKLSGILDSVASNSLIIDVGGVGYMVLASSRTLAKLGQVGEAISMLIDTNVREDAITLYGFLDVAEQEWFRLLLTVQGVGAKAAMSILAVCPPDQLGFAIASSDKAAITRADGVGPKIGTRIVTELKDKAGKIDLAPNSTKTVISNTDKAGQNTQQSLDINNDAVSALVNLGYGRSDAYSAVLHAGKKANDDGDLQMLIKMALKELTT